MSKKKTDFNFFEKYIFCTSFYNHKDMNIIHVKFNQHQIITKDFENYQFLRSYGGP